MENFKSQTGYDRLFKKLWLKMKLTLTIFLFCLAGAAASTYSQNTRLDVKIENGNMVELVKQIEAKSEFMFYYQKNELSELDDLTLEAQNATVMEILDQVTKGTSFDYTVIDRYIVVRKVGDDFGNDFLATARENVAAQQRSVSGKVTDSSNQPLPGVTVVVKGTTQGTVTNTDGDFTLSNIPEDATLVFSFVGMRTQEVVVGSQTSINMTMADDMIGIEEIVAIGYGTMKKGDLTGSVVKADLEIFSESPNSTILESLKGIIPGLDIGQTVRAGQLPDMLIRGQTTLAGSNVPLVVVDGVIFRGSLNNLNPADIESVDILKDASAAAVYGSQATNGVILITTTKGGGIAGKPTISYSNSYSSYSPVRELRPPNVEGFHKQTEESIIFQSRTKESGYLQRDPNWEFTNIFSTNEEVLAYQDGRTTDWYSILTNDNISSNEHHLSMSNSTEYTNYLLSIGYNDQTGYMVNEAYNRLSTRINLDNTLTNWLKIGVQSFMGLSDYSGAEAELNNRYINPYATDTDANGERYKTILAGQINPYIQFERDDFNQNLHLFGNLYAEIDLPFIEGLSHKINFANNYNRNRRYEFRTYAVDFQGEGSKEISFRHDMAMDNILSFKRKFNSHNLQLTLVYGSEKILQDNTRAVGQSFINTQLGYNRLQVADSDKQQAISGAWQEASIYQMVRIFYGFKDKYLLTGTGRRDGFSGFGRENKFGIFPSLSFAWNISEENLIKENILWLDQLKIRLSYGTVGNRTIGRYQTLATVSGGFNFVDMAHSPLYTQSISSLASPNLKWEKTTGVNIGIDFGILSQRIMGNLEYYNNNTTDLFYNVDIPAISRYTNFPDNLGKLHNNGYEMSISSINMVNNNFEWTSTFNFSRNRNKLKELLGFDLDGDGNEDDLISEGLFIGESIDAIYNYEIDGKWQLNDEIPSGFDVGAHKPVDQNGDGIINPADDRKIIGYTTPAYTFGINNSFRLKNWSLKFFIHSIQGGKNHYLGADNYLDFSIQNSEMHYRFIFPDELDYWTPENTDGRYQRPDIKTAVGLRGSLYGDRSFMRLQNISLSYNLPANILKSTGLYNARIYLNGKNLLTFTKWNGWDPETNQTITRNGRPVLKSYSIGLNVEF